MSIGISILIGTTAATLLAVIIKIIEIKRKP